MKIALFADTYYPQRNGVATSVGFLTSALRKFGHKVYVFAPKIKGHEEKETDTLRIPSSRLWPRLPDSARLPLPIPSPAWWEIIRKDYNIIHAHGNGLFSLIGYVVAKIKGIPFVLTFHTLFDKYTHYILKGKIISPKKADFILRVFANRCDGVVAPSEKMRQKLVEIGVKKPIEVIPNFIDISEFKLRQKGFLHTKFNIQRDLKILLTVGRLGKEKNFEFIIRLFAKIAKKETAVQLVIVGGGREENNLKKLIKQLDLTKKVTMTGEIDIKQMPYVYSDADIFVFASTTESQGMVVLEAAAVGLPLVLVKDEAYEAVIKNGVNGFILPLKEEAFVSKIRLLIKHPNMRKEFGTNSIKIARSNIEEKTIVSKHINLYQSLLKLK